ncbi:MAG TPA: DoxX family protein [Arsenicitalea sp.]|jgi:putative oxidoreductase|nr:DoxX family protein [Arsenicitalea sp.]
MNFSRLNSYAPPMLSVLRVVTALVYLEHGTQKLLNFPASARAGGAGLNLFSMFGAAGLIECVAGVLLVLGLFSRAAAFIAAGEMAVAYWMVHIRGGFFPVNNGGDAAIMFCFVFLYVVLAGPGPWSIDALRSRKP